MSLQDGVVVTGTGSASAPTDVVRAALGAESRGAGVAAALGEVVRAVEAMRAALAAAGVADADLSVESTSVNHEPWEEAARPYVARAGLSATLRDPAGAGALVSAVVDAGGDAARLHGLERALDRPEALLPRAREAAVADARARAEQLAGLVGRDLGRVLAVAEHAGGGPRPYGVATLERGAAAAGPGPLPYEPGSASVTVVLQVRWELV
ncbi:SIMPL domain-containing protein [Vallicoccus soli]|uniref:DUF541 domain-containing protein n=1 Tax=Vallicoccus soli TaxID=2339232 RepID=A0A3A3Z2D9_9ACTN|nr:SIMPL domain-containing protein [Vallicoccus soli]RJK96849.1 DUF541 domain-containing protein [Vallicoccus soli]